MAPTAVSDRIDFGFELGIWWGLSLRVTDQVGYPSRRQGGVSVRGHENGLYRNQTAQRDGVSDNSAHRQQRKNPRQ
jgi:hypothetical protein